MRSVLVLVTLLVGCAANTATPEAFVEAFMEKSCAAYEECGVYPSVEVCQEDDGWREMCTSAKLPAWDAERATECLHEVESWACGPDDETREQHPCWHICAPS